jgi:hypothetical protein
MIDTLELYQSLSKGMEPAVADKLVVAMGTMYRELHDELRETITRTDFSRLESVVFELAEAQKRTEHRLEHVAERVEQLAEAQKRTEHRLEQVAERVEQLAEAQKRTEYRVEQLAQAQARTEHNLGLLTERLDDTNAQLGGLSETVGYTLENAVYKTLPTLLKKDFGIDIEGRLKRGYLADLKRPGDHIEVNILGLGIRDNEPILIVGEVKAKISENKASKYLEEILPRLDSGGRKLFPVLVAHMETSPRVSDFIRERGAAFYFSYDLDITG